MRHNISIHAPPRGATAQTSWIGGAISISIHAPPRGATPVIFERIYQHLFQFTPLREGRRNWNSYERLCTNFNSRPSARGDNRLGKRGFFRAYFNSRPSARGDIQSFGRCTSGHLFQFTPLREGRRPFVLCPSVDLLISIHAPPRGATRLPDYWYYSIYISIHAPPRGATSPLQLASTSYDFNSRPSARGDVNQGNVLGIICISIHAPPRGATWAHCQLIR